MIQIIGYDKKIYQETTKGRYKISTFKEFQALDDFELCIIDLSRSEIWKNKGINIDRIDSYKDLSIVKEAILASSKCKILIILPQNEKYYYAGTGYSFHSEEELKNMRTELVKILNSHIVPLKNLKLCFEKTVTTIGKEKVTADFYFSNIEESIFEKILESNTSNKVTSVRFENLIITTLNLITDKPNTLNEFIEKYCIDNDDNKENVPEWISEINFFNDTKLIKEKVENYKSIERLILENEKLDTMLKKNMEYKSILYSTGEELVKVVLEILDEILDNDSSTFIDEKKEDFLIKKDDITFIGEIKGVSSAVQNKNVSQLDVHVQGYKDELEEKNISENIKGLLVINHQRNKKLNERQKIHENQISLAKRNNSLIIETTTLLTLFERFKNEEITTDECKKMFIEKVGLLEI